MPIRDDYQETRRRVITVCIDRMLYSGLKARFHEVDSPILRSVLCLYLSGEFPTGSMELPDDSAGYIGNKAISIAMNLSDYEVYKSCADGARKSVSALVRASLREVVMDVESPYRDLLLTTAGKRKFQIQRLSSR